MTDTPETPNVHIHTIEEAEDAEIEMTQLDTRDELAKLRLKMEVA